MLQILQRNRKEKFLQIYSTDHFFIKLRKLKVYISSIAKSLQKMSPTLRYENKLFSFVGDINLSFTVFPYFSLFPRLYMTE